MEEFTGALLDKRRQLEAVGVDISLLESGLVRLGRLSGQLQLDVEDLRTKIRVLEESVLRINHFLEDLSAIETTKTTDL